MLRFPQLVQEYGTGPLHGQPQHKPPAAFLKAFVDVGNISAGELRAAVLGPLALWRTSRLSDEMEVRFFLFGRMLTLAGGCRRGRSAARGRPGDRRGAPHPLRGRDHHWPAPGTARAAGHPRPGGARRHCCYAGDRRRRAAEHPFGSVMVISFSLLCCRTRGRNERRAQLSVTAAHCVARRRAHPQRDARAVANPAAHWRSRADG